MSNDSDGFVNIVEKIVKADLTEARDKEYKYLIDHYTVDKAYKTIMRHF